MAKMCMGDMPAPRPSMMLRIECSNSIMPTRALPMPAVWPCSAAVDRVTAFARFV
jgi:hypothetical protein